MELVLKFALLVIAYTGATFAFCYFWKWADSLLGRK